MTIAFWLAQATKQLERAGVSTARLDCLVLAGDALGQDKAWLLAHTDHELPDTLTQKLNTQVRQRQNHVPLAHIRSKTEFYGREFYVDQHVLEPRPESETIIDLLKRQMTDEIIVDVGTGSGALAITAKLEAPQATVFAIDIDPECLKVAKRNAQSLHANIHFLQGDLLEPLQDMKFHGQSLILLVNLPYVPDNFRINQAALHEPRLAIFGGPDGLRPYRRLFEQIDMLDTKPTKILTESLPFQHKDLAEIASKHGYMQHVENDFIQLFEPKP